MLISEFFFFFCSLHRRGHGKHTVDIWNNTFSDPKRGVLRLAVAVLSHDPSRPVFFGRICKEKEERESKVFTCCFQRDGRKGYQARYVPRD